MNMPATELIAPHVQQAAYDKDGNIYLVYGSNSGGRVDLYFAGQARLLARSLAVGYDLRAADRRRAYVRAPVVIAAEAGPMAVHRDLLRI